MNERLVRINLADGSAVDIHRNDMDVEICHDKYCVTFPKATGLKTLELFALLESLGETIEFPEEELDNDHESPE